ncbi:hypothetical protein IIW_04895 [Bacillus cereus VD136]|nr:hypothetical protein IIW_04895 [Bacillus cereus VD136]EOP75704.1 hypothetical protein KOW_05348 [Bacillus cereus VDM006]
MTIEKRTFSMIIMHLLLFILTYSFYNIIKMNLIINYIPLLDINLNSLLFIYVIINLNYFFINYNLHNNIISYIYKWNLRGNVNA